MSAVRQRNHPIVRGEHEHNVTGRSSVTLLRSRSSCWPAAEHMPAGQTILAIRGLTKRYGGVTALDNLDLDVKAGEIMALIGPNGAGKTTAFNMITGVLPPTEGSVVLQGTEVAGKRPHIAAESAPRAPSRTCRPSRARPSSATSRWPATCAAKAGLMRGMLLLDRTEEKLIDQASQAAIDAMGLTSLADKQIADLAFGKQRQVEVARALALEPSVLLLDEPMAGLSGPERDSLSWLLRRVKASGVTVLLVEHDVAAVMALADRVAVLDDGKLISLGTPAQVTSDPKVIAAYLGEEDDHSGGPAESGRPHERSFQPGGGRCRHEHDHVPHRACGSRGLTRHTTDCRSCWDVSLHVAPGELLALVGSNGAGKTTVLRSVSGLLKPVRAHVKLGDTDITSTSAEKIAELGLAHVPENRLVFPSLSVEDNLVLGGYVRRKDGRYAVRRDEALHLFPRLRDRINLLAGALSGGEQQMLAMARALMSDPSVIILDEPSLGLAPKVVAEIMTRARPSCATRRAGGAACRAERPSCLQDRRPGHGHGPWPGRGRGHARGAGLRRAGPRGIPRRVVDLVQRRRGPGHPLGRRARLSTSLHLSRPV
jgi:branched-chain amino acid transport system ATP-binding protein